MKRKLLLFLLALFILVALRYVFAHDVGMQCGTTDGSEFIWEPEYDIYCLMGIAPFAGILIALIRVEAQRTDRPILESLRLK